MAFTFLSFVLQTFAKPFPPKLEFELLNEKVPCNVEFAFIVRVSPFNTVRFSKLILTLSYSQKINVYLYHQKGSPPLEKTP
jgi:hypothetical protein